MLRTLTGTVKSGHGKGRDFINALEKDDWLNSFFTDPIFPGTLAVHMHLPIPMKTDLNLLELHSRTYYFPGIAGGIPVILKWCATYPARFQVISTVNLREKFGLKDNSKFIFLVDDNYITHQSISSLIYFVRNLCSNSYSGKILRKLKSIHNNWRDNCHGT
jgi:hypothetical protein